MTAVHKLYGTGYESKIEKVYRNKLKARIVKEFTDFDGKTPGVVVSSAELNSTSIMKDKKFVPKQAAEYLRNDILDYDYRKCITVSGLQLAIHYKIQREIFRHSVDYNFVCEAETAEAEEAQQFFANDGTLQLLEPGTPEALVLTYW
eukprot:gene17104-18825_t